VAVLLTVLLLSFYGCSFSLRVFAATETETRSIITAAEETIVDCYQAVVDAEKMGANVSILLVRLNNASMSLSKANLEYSRGNFDSALDFANESLQKLNGFVEDANVLKNSALQEGRWDFTVNVVG